MPLTRVADENTFQKPGSVAADVADAPRFLEYLDKSAGVGRANAVLV